MSHYESSFTDLDGMRDTIAAQAKIIRSLEQTVKKLQQTCDDRLDDNQKLIEQKTNSDNDYEVRISNYIQNLDKKEARIAEYEKEIMLLRDYVNRPAYQQHEPTEEEEVIVTIQTSQHVVDPEIDSKLVHILTESGLQKSHPVSKKIFTLLKQIDNLVTYITTAKFFEPEIPEYLAELLPAEKVKDVDVKDNPLLKVEEGTQVLGVWHGDITLKDFRNGDIIRKKLSFGRDIGELQITPMREPTAQRFEYAFDEKAFSSCIQKGTNYTIHKIAREAARPEPTASQTKPKQEGVVFTVADSLAYYDKTFPLDKGYKVTFCPEDKQIIMQQVVNSVTGPQHLYEYNPSKTRFMSGISLSK